MYGLSNNASTVRNNLSINLPTQSKCLIEFATKFNNAMYTLPRRGFDFKSSTTPCEKARKFSFGSRRANPKEQFDVYLEQTIRRSENDLSNDYEIIGFEMVDRR